MLNKYGINNNIVATVLNEMPPSKLKLVNKIMQGEPVCAYEASRQFNCDELSSIVLHYASSTIPVDNYRELCLVLLEDYGDNFLDHLVRLERSFEGAYKVLDRLLNRMNIELPKWHHETVTVWRGTAGISEEKARDGLWWTLDRNAAIDIAITESRRKKRPVMEPLVLRADVPVENIRLFLNIKNFAEVIILNGPWGRIDGNKEEWLATYEINDEGSYEHHSYFPSKNEVLVMPVTDENIRMLRG